VRRVQQWSKLTSGVASSHVVTVDAFKSQKVAIPEALRGQMVSSLKELLDDDRCAEAGCLVAQYVNDKKQMLQQSMDTDPVGSELVQGMQVAVVQEVFAQDATKLATAAAGEAEVMAGKYC
jgi:hypothetical protein